MIDLHVRDRARVGNISKGQLVGAGAEVDAVGAAQGSAQCDRVRKIATDDSLDVRDGRDVGELAERELIGARAEIDRRPWTAAAADRDRVACGAADERLDVRDGRRVGAGVGQSKRVLARAEIERAVRNLSRDGDCIGTRAGNERSRRWRREPSLAKLPRVELVAAGAEVNAVRGR